MEGSGWAERLIRVMKEYIVHQKGAGALASAIHTAPQIASERKPAVGAGGAGGGGPEARPVIKLGLDIHSRLYVVVAQSGHCTPKPARRFTPEEFAPWVEALRRALVASTPRQWAGLSALIHSLARNLGRCPRRTRLPPRLAWVAPLAHWCG